MKVPLRILPHTPGLGVTRGPGLAWACALLVAVVGCGTPTDGGLSGTGDPDVALAFGDLGKPKDSKGDTGAKDGVDPDVSYADSEDDSSWTDSDTSGPDALTDATDDVAAGDGSGPADGGDGANSSGDTDTAAGDASKPDVPPNKGTGCEFELDPKPGQPGAACATNADCKSQKCVDTGSEKICTQACVSCCPTGTQCKNTGTPSSPDFFCMPTSVSLCKPCDTDAACKLGSPGAVCISYGKIGSYCGGACEKDANCPMGYVCAAAEGTAPGAETKQCLRVGGECSCSAKAIAEGATTSCTQSNAAGVCNGLRKCEANGLTTCSAPVPAAESCNGVDDDCDGTTDPENAGGCASYFGDKDQDGFGAGNASCLCAATSLASSATSSDCDDKAAATFPGATEVCNGVDDDCDGTTDEACDADGDGWCAAGAVVIGAPAVCASGVGDCADNDPAIYPDQLESCGNGKDDDCDGQTDSGASLQGCVSFYKDKDKDGYGTGAGICDCNPVGEFVVTKTGDCNDDDGEVHPGALEVCANGKDDDCDDKQDDGAAVNCQVYFPDNDGDGFGTGLGKCQCYASAALGASQGGDCADNETGIHPGAEEACNALDDNCDGATDEGVQATFYLDADKDGYGDAGQSKDACTLPPGYAKLAGDCNDSKGTANPAAVEHCDGVDNDCNGQTDEGTPLDCALFYVDADGDTYGGTLSACLCSPTATFSVLFGGDCDDTVKGVHPGAKETCNVTDDNCNGQIDEVGALGCSAKHADADGDTYGAAASACACPSDPTYTTLNGDDCDDTQADVRPGVAETCNGIDDNCDGKTDPASSDNCVNYFFDGDTDTYGDAVNQPVKCLCTPVGAWNATKFGDCKDGDKSIHPGATEVCNNKDENCDGTPDNGAGTWYYADADGDTFGNPLVAYQSCSVLATFVTNKLDCDDAKGAIKPGAIEVCDGIDNDCNGQTDDGLCDDGKPCTVDTCTPGSGCTHSNNSAGCNDGDPCTVGETCASGSCTGGTVTGCDDGDACTQDSCLNPSGCTHTALSPCDDGNVCTSDACDPATGCTFLPNSGACSDGSACTSGDACSAGTCSGSAVLCQDTNPCTNDACSPSTGCVFTNNAVACNDNSVCTSGDKCGGGVCAGTAVNCDDGDPCTADSCLGPDGCQHATTCVSTLPFADPGSSYAEGLNSAGNLLAWGNAATPPSGTWAQVSAGYYFACVIDAADKMKCWGANTPSSLSTTQSGIQQVSVGNDHACAIKTDGGLACWGNTGASTPMISPPSGTNYVQVSAGHYHTCALRTDGTVKCWGDSGLGQLTVPAGQTFSQIAAGYDFTCGLRKTGGGITCWGDDYTNAVSKAPQTGSFLSLTADNMACAIQTDNVLKCWTSTTYGSVPPASTKWQQVASSEGIVCGVLTNKTVKCFGSDADGIVSGVPTTGW